MTTDYIYGKNSVLAVLEHDPERVFKVFMVDNLKPDKRINAIYKLALDHNIQVIKVPRPKLDGMVDDREANHQGVLASVSPRKLLDVEDLIKKCQPKLDKGEYPLILMLDGVTDPRNFGSILRVCDAAGVDGVIVPKHKSAGFGPAVAKTASGAEATVDVAVVTNLGQTIQKLKDSGFWLVAAACSEKAVDYYKQDYKMPTVLVLGSEGEGLGRLIEQNCDFWVNIPMAEGAAVDSLNVSAAAAVLVFDIRARQGG